MKGGAEKFDSKSTPKISQGKGGLITKSGVKIKSQNVSSHGTRGIQSTNMGSTNALVEK